MIDIYDSNGTLIPINPLVTKESTHEEEMMVSNFVKLSWTAKTKQILPAGSYIVPFPDELDAVRTPLKYILLEPYEPTAEKESKFRYEPKFHHPIMLLSKIPFIHLTGDTTTWETATKNYEWSYTGPAGTIADEIARYINLWGSRNAAFLRIFGNGWTAALTGDDLPSSASLTFDAYDVLSAASEAASKFNCEYHFDFNQKIFHFGVISYERNVHLEPFELKVGKNVSPASVTASKEGYYNRYVVRGGTRNLSKTTESGENVQITERLTLSSDYPESAIDLRGNENVEESMRAEENEPMLTGELVFEDVYPKIELYIYNPRERRCYLLDNDGNKVVDQTSDTGYKMYSKWYIRLAFKVSTAISGKTPVKTEEIDGQTWYWYDFPMSRDLVIKDKILSIAFQANRDSQTHNSPLSGREFDLVWFETQTIEKETDDYDPDGFTAQPDDYRIVFKEENNVILPTTSNGGLYPRGDALPSTDNNKATLFNLVVDDTYKLVAQSELYDTAIKAIKRLRSDLNNYTVSSYPVVFRKENEDIHVGQTVVYDDGQDLNGGTSYRLTTHVRKIVTRLDNPNIKDITVGNEKQRGSISSMKEQIQTIILGGGGSGGSGGFTQDQMRQLIENYVSLRYLSKLYPDTAQGKITFKQGTHSNGDSTFGEWVEDASGAAIHQDTDGNWHIEADFLHARKKLTAKELVIEEVKHIGGKLMLTAAECICDYVIDYGDYWRCFFLKRDEDGKEVRNDWLIGDQALMQSFNVTQWEDGDERTPDAKGLRNRYYWRLVIGTDLQSNISDFNDDFNDDFGGGTLPNGVNVSEYHWIDLKKDKCAVGSDEPMAEDKIVQLGFIGTDKMQDRLGYIIEEEKDRQNAIVIAGAGTGSPYIDEYEDIDDYSLEGKVMTRIKPGDNRFTGIVKMIMGSKYGGKTLEEIFGIFDNDFSDIDQHIGNVENTIENLSSGSENLLRNTGFTGDYLPIETNANDTMSDGTPVYSEPLAYWEHGGATVRQDVVSQSGNVCDLSDGWLAQKATRAVMIGQEYRLSFRAKGTSLTVSFAGHTETKLLDSATVRRYTVRIKAVGSDTEANTFRILNADCRIFEIMLTEGTVDNADWLPSPLDNDKTLAYWQNLVYLSNAIANASTSILGGLILTQMIRVGNYRDNEMTQETGGMSGLYTSGNSPFLWGGGTMKDAFYTINKYAQDPSYQATEEEVAQMAKFVVTHGGRAILNDIILRGYIYALGGYFKGEVVAEKGSFKNVSSPNGNFSLDEDGTMSCTDAKISGNIYTPLFVIDDSNWNNAVVSFAGRFSLRLDITGLNIQMNYAERASEMFSQSEQYIIALPLEEAYIGARVNILNLSGVNLTIFVSSGGFYQLSSGNFGTYLCYKRGSVSWIKINT